MVYSGARRRQFLSFGLRTTMLYALERESDHGSTSSVLSSYQKEEMSVADLCREYGISRPTGYRWINRYNETGPEGLVDRSCRPHGRSHATLEPVENAIFALRDKHPSWGARKLKARLEMLHRTLKEDIRSRLRHPFAQSRATSTTISVTSAGTKTEPSSARHADWRTQCGRALFQSCTASGLSLPPATIIPPLLTTLCRQRMQT